MLVVGRQLSFGARWLLVLGQGSSCTKRLWFHVTKCSPKTMKFSWAGLVQTTYSTTTYWNNYNSTTAIRTHQYQHTRCFVIDQLMNLFGQQIKNVCTTLSTINRLFNFNPSNFNWRTRCNLGFCNIHHNNINSSSWLGTFASWYIYNVGLDQHINNKEVATTTTTSVDIVLEGITTT